MEYFEDWDTRGLNELFNDVVSPFMGKWHASLDRQYVLSAKDPGICILKTAKDAGICILTTTCILFNTNITVPCGSTSNITITFTLKIFRVSENQAASI